MSAPPDILTNSIGDFSPYQLCICMLILIAKYNTAGHLLSYIFMAAPIEVSCKTPNENVDVCSEACPEREFNRSIFEENIISEFELVCDKSFLASLSQSIMAVGIMVGCMIFGFMADRWGRRPAFLLGCYLQLIISFCVSVSPGFWLHLFLRFLIGIVTGGTMNISFVIVMEIVGPKYREIIAILYQVPFSVGHACLSLIAYYIRHWRWMYFFLSVCHLTYLPFYCLVPETARWLFSTGQLDKAAAVLLHGARFNKKSLHNIDENLAEAHRQKPAGTTKKGNISDLFRTSNLRLKTLLMGFNWLCFCICYYGVSMYVTHIVGNIFLNVLYSSSLGLLGVLFCIPCTMCLGRRITLLLANLICGLCLLVIALTSYGDYAILHVGLASFGLFATSINFGNCYLYTGELFPTVVRNSGVGFASLIGRFGTIAAPMVVWCSKFAPWIPTAIFAGCSLLSAMTVVFLPETRGHPLPETLEDGENFGKK